MTTLQDLGKLTYIFLSDCSSVYRLTELSFWLFLYISTYYSVCPSVCLFFLCLFLCVHFYVFLSVCLSIYPSVTLLSFSNHILGTSCYLNKKIIISNRTQSICQSFYLYFLLSVWLSFNLSFYPSVCLTYYLLFRPLSVCPSVCPYVFCHSVRLSHFNYPLSPTFQSFYFSSLPNAGNTKWKGRLSTVDLLIRVACSIKSNWSKLVITRRSTELCLPLQ